ncbi:hypothetical protein BCR32DRAFT_291651 [Anaeromyces robustus]|uniref:Uncharacterized protein n=1 Tax=Anaeromyces robustus TaxID=1754192 RepID=A0A1Y1XE19_9FUNG|nr:hypothetical protein BCR32DRAFT_291651 [Anaeromyces robustus]|eukprot:ORX83979.1 hypothetical protein BCR32DRAFT_291651 [Anaeromyces robustus]
MNPQERLDSINSSLNSSQIHDFGFAERKRYGQFNNFSDIFNVKNEENNGNNNGKYSRESEYNNNGRRKYQNHHYQLTSPFGRDDIAVDNPHKVQSFYNINENNNNNNNDNNNEPSYLLPQTEPNMMAQSEMSNIEGGNYYDSNSINNNNNNNRINIISRESMRNNNNNNNNNNGIERHEDIFVSREDLQTPEQRKESLLRRQKLDQLLNNNNNDLPQTQNQNQTQTQTKYAAPFATSFDNKNNNNNNNNDNNSVPRPLNSSISVSSLAPFATVEYNPYDKYVNEYQEIPSTNQVKEYNQFISHHGHHSTSNSNPHAYHHINVQDNIPDQVHDDEEFIPDSSYHHIKPLSASSNKSRNNNNNNKNNISNYDQSQDYSSTHPLQTSSSPSLQTPYFHETSSRPLPREDEIIRGKGEEELQEKKDYGNKQEEMKEMNNNNNNDNNDNNNISKDHITSSFDKATALSDRNYFNKIMNDHQPPKETPEELINKEKYEEAKNRFDELYRDLMATEDLKNHPELLEELNKISGTESMIPSNPNDITTTEKNLVTSPTPMNYNDNVNSNAPKEDYIHSLEDLDKKLEKISFDSNQQITDMKGPKETITTTTTNEHEHEQHEHEHEHEHNNNIEQQEQEQQEQQYPPHHHHPNRKNYNESHIFDTPDPLPTSNSSSQQQDKSRFKISNSYNNIFGSPELDAEVEKQAQENRKLYSRRHLKLAQQNYSDIFCLGGSGNGNGNEQQKLIASNLGSSELPPEVPPLQLYSRRSSQANLQTSRDNPMLTTYGSMNKSASNLENRRQMAEQPTFGLSSVQSHHTYKTKSRKYTPANSSQILF